MSSQHKRPIMAFVVLFVLAAAVIGNGLRAEADRGTFITAGPIAVHPPLVHGQVGDDPATPSPQQLLETSLDALEPPAGTTPSTIAGSTGRRQMSVAPRAKHHPASQDTALAVPGQGGPRAPGGTVGVPGAETPPVHTSADDPGDRAARDTGRGHTKHASGPKADHRGPGVDHRPPGLDHRPGPGEKQAHHVTRPWPSRSDHTRGSGGRGRGWGHDRDSDRHWDRHSDQHWDQHWAPRGDDWKHRSDRGGNGVGAVLHQVTGRVRHEVDRGIGELVRGLVERRAERVSRHHGRSA